MNKLIGIVGGYGAVGSVVARLLAGRGYAVRIGGRDRGRSERFVREELGGAGEAAVVDAADRAGTDRFCAGCAVVVCCAGPSHAVLDRVARAAFAAGADYVDPGGDAPLYRLMTSSGLPRDGRVAVLSAGMMPGLTGLVPRWLAAGLDRPASLAVYVRSRDRFTPAAAGDYLLALAAGDGEADAAWRGGRRAPGVLRPLTNAELPYFPEPVNAFPYLDSETERLAVALRLAEVDRYTIFDGGPRMLATLARLGETMSVPGKTVPGERAPGVLSAAVAELVRVADLELFGRQPSQRFVFRLDGESAGVPATRTAVLVARDAYELTGLFAAHAAARVAAGEVPAGCHFAAEVLDPGVLDEMRTDPIMKSLEIIDGTPGDEVFEEGSL